MHALTVFLKNISWSCLLLLLLLSSLKAQVNSEAPYNKTILEAIASMPLGGGYSTSSSSVQQMRHAVTIHDGILTVNATHAQPSFCSEATYLVFLKTLALLQTRKQLVLNPATLIALQPKGEADGDGIWGRWNANGPGVACLFHALGSVRLFGHFGASPDITAMAPKYPNNRTDPYLYLGKNFTDLREAQPGDFLKIFWSDAIGSSEHGHLVVYLGRETKNGIEMIHFWSSNQHVGYSEKAVPLRAMHHLIFSRLLHPEALHNSFLLPKSDPYLASLLRRPSSMKEVMQRCEINSSDKGIAE